MLPRREEVDDDNKNNKNEEVFEALPTRMRSCILKQVRRTMKRMMEMMIRLNGSHVCHVRYEKNDQIASIVMVLC
jgi:hypothetical protein